MGQTARDAIQSTLDAGKSVLVHCAQGRSRSGSVVVYYVSRSEKLDIHEALKKVQDKRAMAQPNDHFMKLLIAMKSEVDAPPTEAQTEIECSPEQSDTTTPQFDQERTNQSN